MPFHLQSPCSKHPGIVVPIVLHFFLSLPVAANGLGENNPWKFSHKNKLRMLEMQTLKDAGFYDQQNGPAGNRNGGGAGGGDTIINGNQINCVLQSVTTANSNHAGLSATTGSYAGVTDSDIHADTHANESEVWSDGDSPLDIGQSNTADLSAAVDASKISSHVGKFTGGGTTDQAIDIQQSADNSTMTSAVKNSTVCNGMSVN